MKQKDVDLLLVDSGDLHDGEYLAPDYVARRCSWGVHDSQERASRMASRLAEWTLTMSVLVFDFLANHMLTNPPEQ